MSRTGSVGSAEIAVPTWTATAPTAREFEDVGQLSDPPMATIGTSTTWATS